MLSSMMLADEEVNWNDATQQDASCQPVERDHLSAHLKPLAHSHKLFNASFFSMEMFKGIL